MKRNVGNVDRIIRVILAAVFAYLYFSGTVTGTLGIILLVLGAMLLVTGLVGFCGLYNPLKINTYKG